MSIGGLLVDQKQNFWTWMAFWIIWIIQQKCFLKNSVVEQANRQIDYQIDRLEDWQTNINYRITTLKLEWFLASKQTN